MFSLTHIFASNSLQITKAEAVPPTIEELLGYLNRHLDPRFTLALFLKTCPYQPHLVYDIIGDIVYDNYWRMLFYNTSNVYKPT